MQADPGSAHAIPLKPADVAQSRRYLFERAPEQTGRMNRIIPVMFYPARRRLRPARRIRQFDRDGCRTAGFSRLARILEGKTNANSTERRRNGEAWRRIGVAAYRRGGVAAWRRSGVAACRRAGVPAYRRSGVPASRRAGVSAYRRTGVPACRRVGVAACRRAAVPENAGRKGRCLQRPLRFGHLRLRLSQFSAEGAI